MMQVEEPSRQIKSSHTAAHDHSMTGSLSRTACSRCREQKVKCGRELPKCSRCCRVNANCTFPEPPDRKLLATYRSSYGTHTKRRRSSESSPKATPSSFTALLSAAEGALDFQIGTCADITNQLSRPLRQFLINVYFTHMYNSWLIFHRPTLLAKIEAGLVPAHVLVAIYATATIFLLPDSCLVRTNANLLNSFGDLKSLGEQWATQAGREVLPEVIDPTIESIQTVQTLSLFWFSAGHPRTNSMFSGIAYKAAYVYGLDNPHLKPTAGESITWIDHELARRLFWATWLTNCIVSEHYIAGTSINDSVLNLPLPVDDISFRNGIQVPSITARQALEQQKNQTFDEPRSPPSIMAELVKLMMIWAAIGDYLEARKNQLGQESLVALFDLDRRLSDWTRCLHPNFIYSKSNLYKQLVIEQQLSYIFVHALYHQCCLALHSSLVPQFSGISVDTTISVEVINVSARVAHKHAQAISEIGSDLVALNWEFSRTPPFVGYCMYVSASIHIVFLFSQNPALAMAAKQRLVSNLKVLSAMKGYWSNIEGLWARIHILYEAQTSPIQQSLSSDRASELDALGTLALKQRETGRLEEPLAASVLEYGLCIKPTDVKEGAINDIERRICHDLLPPITDRQLFSVTPQDLMTTLTSTYLQNPNSVVTPDIMATHEPADMFSGDQLFASTLSGFSQEGGEVWLQSDLGNLT